MRSSSMAIPNCSSPTAASTAKASSARSASASRAPPRVPERLPDDESRPLDPDAVRGFGSCAGQALHAGRGVHRREGDRSRRELGPVAEVYTEAVLRCLVEWKKVEVLANGMAQDKDYNAWVVRHVRSATPDDQKSVYARAKMSCPKGLDEWCTGLADISKPLVPFKGIDIAPMPTFNEPPKK